MVPYTTIFHFNIIQSKFIWVHSIRCCGPHVWLYIKCTSAYKQINLHSGLLLDKQVFQLSRKKPTVRFGNVNKNRCHVSVFRSFTEVVQTNYTGLSLQICVQRWRQHKPSLETSNLVYKHTLTWRQSIMYPKDPLYRGVALLTTDSSEMCWRSACFRRYNIQPEVYAVSWSRANYLKRSNALTLALAKSPNR